MAEFLVIRLGADASRPVQWIAVDDSGTLRSRSASGTLEEAQQDIGERPVIVLVPAAATLTTSIDIPVRGGARLLAALPFALEEQLAEDVDTLHFAAGARRSSGLLPVVVVAHVQMREWLDRLKKAAIRPSRMIPENSGLARVTGTLSLLVAEDQVMFNDGADTEFLMQSVKPSDALAAAGVFDETDANNEAGVDNSAGHLVVYCESVDEEKFSQDWAALRLSLASVDLHLLRDGVLPRLAVTVAAGAGINLLQGPYGAKTDIEALVRPWRYAALLLLTLGFVTIGGKAVENFRLGQEQASLQEQFNREYREMRPNDTQTVVDPIAIVNSIRRSLGAPAAPQAFLPALDQIGKALEANASADVEAVSYRAGVVDIRLSAPDVATLDSIQKMISQSGRFTASIQSTDQVGDKVNSRIQVREVGA
jgi:general secretion pathway protein L